ncbi:MAG TPA: polysaccharide deacetylase family protein [Candidatus Paceibacterota bacterium]|jgi:peptidoglycan/xylan/chitin deacetylase (PgdA/CDA1 family)|nr:polysaccharide deacetylase family protein [Candidatus Paceibacterota bacterium]
MKHRRRAYLLAGAMLILAGWGLWSWQTREPVYQGKRLSRWLAMLDSVPPGEEETPPERSRAAVSNALTAMGTNALPRLLQLVSRAPGDSWLRMGIDWVNGKQDWVRIPLRRQPPWPELAAEALRILGTNAAPALPQLTLLYHQEPTCPLVAPCLDAMGPVALDCFIQGLTNASSSVRTLSLFSLAELGPSASPAVPAVEAITREPGPASGLALEVLARIDPEPTRLVPLLRERLTDSNQCMQAAAALALLGSNGLPVLVHGLTNTQRQARIAILAALDDTFQQAVRSPPDPPEASGFRRLTCLYNLRAGLMASVIYQSKESCRAVPSLARLIPRLSPSDQLLVLTNLAGYGVEGLPGLAFAARETEGPVRHTAETLIAQLPFESRQGAILRGPTDRRRIALVFTGHEYAEGGPAILDALEKHQARASFFLTGDFLSHSNHAALVQRLIKAGHFLGPHSDKHLLYCSWDHPPNLLVTRPQFLADLQENQAKIQLHYFKSDEAAGLFARRYGAPPSPAAESDAPQPIPPLPAGPQAARFFLPPFEHYNEEIALWTRELGMTLINFTPGTRSNADYTGEADRNFVPSSVIYDSILARERQDPNGLNGFILLLHLGAGPGRQDKFHTRFGGLLDVLAAKGYEFVRVDELLDSDHTGGSMAAQTK